ncbi:MAG: hypothetical protein MZV65_09625 [Chromatiales bacterium]|nr:hypothetical protein [Chromatiales bacterium]
MRRVAFTAVALSAFLPTLASAQVWMPYAPQATGVVEPLPPAGYPGAYGPPTPPASWSTPTEAGANWPAAPYAAPGMPPAGFESAPWPPQDASERMAYRERPAWPRLSLSRRATDDAYLIEIQLANIQPDQVEIRPAGRGLLITHNAMVRFTQSEPLPGGDGYQSRYSLSRDTSGRRVGLPPDADLAGMTREVEDGRILIRVPRVADAWRGGRW